MRLFIILFLLLASTIPLISAFNWASWENDDCTGDPEFEDWVPSDNGCWFIEGGYSFKYTSSINCTFYTYPDAWCSTQQGTMQREGVCYTPGYRALGLSCEDIREPWDNSGK